MPKGAGDSLGAYNRTTFLPLPEGSLSLPHPHPAPTCHCITQKCHPIELMKNGERSPFCPSLAPSPRGKKPLIHFHRMHPPPNPIEGGTVFPILLYRPFAYEACFSFLLFVPFNVIAPLGISGLYLLQPSLCSWGVRVGDWLLGGGGVERRLSPEWYGGVWT